jgi:hypothetical protein
VGWFLGLAGMLVLLDQSAGIGSGALSLGHGFIPRILKVVCSQS